MGGTSDGEAGAPWARRRNWALALLLLDVIAVRFFGYLEQRRGFVWDVRIGKANALNLAFIILFFGSMGCAFAFHGYSRYRAGDGAGGLARVNAYVSMAAGAVALVCAILLPLRWLSY